MIIVSDRRKKKGKTISIKTTMQLMRYKVGLSEGISLTDTTQVYMLYTPTLGQRSRHSF